jgi:hypothetical protein
MGGHLVYVGQSGKSITADNINDELYIGTGKCHCRFQSRTYSIHILIEVDDSFVDIVTYQIQRSGRKYTQ